MTGIWPLALLCALVLAGCSGGDEARTLTSQRLLERIEAGDAPLILDVRTPEEFASGRVPGAINIPDGELAARVDELGPARDREIVVYCERGGRASRAASILRAARFSAVEHLAGDMSAWRSERLPCEGC